MDIGPLKNMGFSDGEIKVYLAMLKIGLSTAGPIIKETGLQSSSVYHILDALSERGIVSSVTKNQRKHFHAVSPEKLLTILDEKKKKLDDEKTQIEKMLPMLHGMEQLSKPSDQETLIFEGWNGVLSAFQEAYKQIKPGTTLYSYVITKEFGGADPDQVRWLINKVRKMRDDLNKKSDKKIVMKIIAEKGSEIGIDQSKTRYTQVKFIAKHYTNPAVVNVYGDITIIALWLKKPIAFHITSKEVADSFMNTFELLWTLSEKKL